MDLSHPSASSPSSQNRYSLRVSDFYQSPRDVKSDVECTYSNLGQHADLWFKDGSVVLRAENVLFKVHISQLSRHSTLFRDMFSLPQPKGNALALTSQGNVDSDSLTEVDGCPIVHLHDSAEDVGNLLTALYDGPWVLVSLKH
jgi:hypothetical protein